MSALAAESLAHIPGVWRGLDRPRGDVESTGLPALDQALLGGWPRGALSQLVGDEPGLGFSLLLPLLANLTQAGRYVALVSPPYIPYAPALRDAGIDLRRLRWIEPKDRYDSLWATEQMLRAGLVGAVVLWCPSLEPAIERRLQLAAETGRSIGIIAQHGRCESHSIVAVRLHISTAPSLLRVDVRRCRGGRPGARVDLRSSDACAA